MLEDRIILIVEDEPLVALDLVDATGALGAQVIGPIQTASHALEIVTARAIDGAILDARLPDGEVTPVALFLLGRCIPFVIHSGTGMPAELAAAAPDVPLIRKPVPSALVAERLALEIARRTSDTFT